MFAGLRALALACCGIPPNPPQPDDWKKELAQAGYIVTQWHGVFFWYHAPSHSKSGRYATEHGAWVGAKLDHDHWKEEHAKR